MNINKIVKDSVSSIKNRYENTQLNPFKVPEKITIKVDLAGSYADLFKAMEDMDEKKAEHVVKVLSKFGQIIEKVVDNKFKK